MKKTTIYNLSQLEFFTRHLICMQKGHVAEFSGTGVEFLGRAVRRARQTQRVPAGSPAEHGQTENGQYCVKNKKRFTNLLLLVKQQSVVYSFGQQTLTVPAGGLAFVPKGASYNCTEPQGTGYLFAEFDLFCENGEELQIGTFPVLLFKQCPENITQALNELYTAFAGEEFKTNMYCNILLYRILLYISGETGAVKANRAEQAVSLCKAYLKRHCCESVSTAQLCKVSGLCPTQLRLYFKKITGRTPVDYKNFECVKKAQQQLLQTNLTVSCIAELLGFENAFYFSRVFKMYTGVSPKMYREKAAQKKELK